MREYHVAIANNVSNSSIQMFGKYKAYDHRNVARANHSVHQLGHLPKDVTTKSVGWVDYLTSFRTRMSMYRALSMLARLAAGAPVVPVAESGFWSAVAESGFCSAVAESGFCSAVAESGFCSAVAESGLWSAVAESGF